MISFSLVAKCLSTKEMNLSVSSCTLASASLHTSSLKPFFCNFLICSIASRRILLIATFDCSPSFNDLFTSSFLLSSVRGGRKRRIILPSFCGFKPILVLDDRSLNGLQHVFFPWLNGKCTCIGNRNVANLAYQGGVSVIINNDSINNIRSSFSCSNLQQF